MMTPKEQYAPLADPDGFQLYWAARALTGIDIPSSFHYEDNRGMFETASGHTLLRYLTALRFNAVQWAIMMYTMPPLPLGAARISRFPASSRKDAMSC